MFSIRLLKITLAGSLSMGLLAPSAGAASEAVVHAFQGAPNDGASPYAGLINVGGTLYGTTQSGGANDYGTVFKLTTKGVERVLHSFGFGSDGSGPDAGLIDVNGTLYGTTNSGGSGGSDANGTVFKITTKGVETVLHSFISGNGGSDGTTPVAGLINVGGTLYGTTKYGGSNGCLDANGCGTVFKITTKGAEKVLYSFKGGNDGMVLEAGLIDVGGTLYGTTLSGGTNTWGTVFKLTTAGMKTVLHSFGSGSDGTLLSAGLNDVGGTLYGTTTYGGSGSCNLSDIPGCGTVFKITTKGVETVLYSFKGGSDGAYPQAGLIDVGGTLYGTTTYGGSGSCSLFGYLGCGTVFKITTTGVETALYSFKGGSDGAYPNAGLINVGGTLYGTTTYGGGGGSCNLYDILGCGTVFKVTP